MSNVTIRTPKQLRSIEKKQRIKAAALKLISEKGYHSTSSNEIVKEAGVSIGTFYSYFKDKKDLYTELVEDIYDVVLTPVNFNHVPDNLSVEAVVHSYIESIFKGHEYESRFQREIASLSEQSDEFRAIEMKHKTKVTESFINMLNTYKAEMKVKDLYTTSYILLTSIEAIVHDTQFHNNGQNKEAVINELTAMIINYLF